LVVKKGFEDLVHHGRGMPTPVSHTSTAHFSLRRVVQGDGLVRWSGPSLGPTFLDGVPGIDEQVDEHLLQPVRVGVDAGKVGSQVPYHLDAPHLELLAENLEGLVGSPR
jgi:hypothetical protein